MSVECLLGSLLPAGVTVLLRNASGTMELRGDDLALKTSDAWLTIYHASAEGEGGSETRSHLHLRRSGLGLARVVEKEGRTPVLEFWPSAEQIVDGARPPLAVVFPSFYDWQADKAPIPRNREWFRAWVGAHGRRFELDDA